MQSGLLGRHDIRWVCFACRGGGFICILGGRVICWVWRLMHRGVGVCRIRWRVFLVYIMDVYIIVKLRIVWWVIICDWGCCWEQGASKRVFCHCPCSYWQSNCCSIMKLFSVSVRIFHKNNTSSWKSFNGMYFLAVNCCYRYLLMLRPFCYEKPLNNCFHSRPFICFESLIIMLLCWLIFSCYVML